MKTTSSSLIVRITSLLLLFVVAMSMTGCTAYNPFTGRPIWWAMTYDEKVAWASNQPGAGEYLTVDKLTVRNPKWTAPVSAEPVVSETPVVSEQPTGSTPVVEQEKASSVQTTDDLNAYILERVRALGMDEKAITAHGVGVLPLKPYVSGQPGYPEICDGLCWDFNTPDLMVWYGKNAGEEDIRMSDRNLGDGTMSPVNRVRTGKVHTVVVGIAKPSSAEVCAIGTFDRVPLSQLLGKKEGECGRIDVAPGWHIIENNADSMVAGIGFTFSGAGTWADPSLDQNKDLAACWNISGDTATWKCATNTNMRTTQEMKKAMEIDGTLKNLVFNPSVAGYLWLCNGYVDGTQTINSDGACRNYPVSAGTYTYHGSTQTSTGASFNLNPFGK